MKAVFVVRNQLGHFWGKKKCWVDGTAPRKIQACKHEDEAVNLLVELSAKDVELRGEVVEVEVDDKQLPLVEPSEHLLPEDDEPASAGGTGQEPNAGTSP